MSKEQKSAGALKTWLTKKKGVILKTSAVLFAVCYGLTYLSGASNAPTFMAVTLGVLAVACLLPAALD